MVSDKGNETTYCCPKSARTLFGTFQAGNILGRGKAGQGFKVAVKGRFGFKAGIESNTENCHLFVLPGREALHNLCCAVAVEQLGKILLQSLIEDIRS